MSASAPAGSASSISGKLSAASTSATIDGEDESEVISQPAPTSCIQVPTFETIVAIHRLRNSAVCSGLHAERSAAWGCRRREKPGMVQCSRRFLAGGWSRHVARMRLSALSLIGAPARARRRSTSSSPRRARAKLRWDAESRGSASWRACSSTRRNSRRARMCGISEDAPTCRRERGTPRTRCVRRRP